MESASFSFRDNHALQVAKHKFNVPSRASLSIILSIWYRSEGNAFQNNATTTKLMTYTEAERYNAEFCVLSCLTIWFLYTVVQL